MRRYWVLVFLCACLPLQAEVIEVSDASGGFGAIQAAIEVAKPGDEVVLAPGEYHGLAGHPLSFLGKALTLRSTDPNDPNVVASTVLKCPESTHALVFDQYETDQSVLAGLTITGGQGARAILCENAGPTIVSCVIQGNMAGGIECQENLFIRNCVFQENYALDGGAIYSTWRCDKIDLEQCVFQGNEAMNLGGAIYMHGGSLKAKYCQWTGNMAMEGGGVYLDFFGDECQFFDCIAVANHATVSGGFCFSFASDVLTFASCSLVGNSAGESGGAFYDDTLSEKGLVLVNSIVAHNQDALGLGHSIHATRRVSTGGGRGSDESKEYAFEDLVNASFCCLQTNSYDAAGPYAESEDIIHTAPLLRRVPDHGGDGWGDDPCTPILDEGLNDDYGDLRLKAESPCVDTGHHYLAATVNILDIQGLPRITGGDIDMGAYEYPRPTILVTRPEGGEVWAAGSQQAIKWLSEFVPGTVDILFDPGDNLPWQTIAQGLVNTGSYVWHVTESLPLDHARIHVKPSVSAPDDYHEESGVFTVTLMSPGLPTESSWSTLGASAQRTGSNGVTGPSALSPAWSFEIPGPVFTSAVVGYANRVHVASEQGIVYTLSDQGELLWTFDATETLYSTPTVGSDGSVYLGSEQDRVIALDVDGQISWTWHTQGFVYASVAVSDQGNVYVASQDGTLYALSPNGSLVWSYAVPKLALPSDALLASPSLGADGTVFIGSLFSSTLYAVNPQDGSLKWSTAFTGTDDRPTGNKNRIMVSAIVSPDGRLYQALIDDPFLYALDASTGESLWLSSMTTPLSFVWDESAWSEPALGPDGTIYVSYDDPMLRAVNSDGTMKWTVQLGTEDGFTLAVGGDGLIYAAGGDGVLYIVNQDGQQVGQYESQGSLGYPVITENGRLLVTDVDFGIRAFDQMKN